MVGRHRSVEFAVPRLMPAVVCQNVRQRDISHPSR